MTTKVQALFLKLNLNAPEKTSEKPQTESHLMKLSGELRNEIYKQVAVSENARLWLVGWHCHATRPKPPAGIALIMTCKQIRREAYEIVWDNMFLELEVSNLKRSAAAGVENLWNSKTLRQIRNIRIYFEPVPWTPDSRASELELEQRDYDLEGILLWNQQLKRLELLSHGRLDGLGGTGVPRDDAINRRYSKRFPDLLWGLKAKQTSIGLYNTTTKKMEDDTEFTRNVFELVKEGHS